MLLLLMVVLTACSASQAVDAEFGETTATEPTSNDPDLPSTSTTTTVGASTTTTVAQLVVNPDTASATRLEVDFEVLDAVEWDGGLLALAGDRDGNGQRFSALELHRSDNGSEWTAVADVSLATGEGLDSLSFVSFLPATDGLALLGSRIDGTRIAAVSADGSTWEVVDVNAAIGVRDGSFVGVSKGMHAIEQLVRQHTTLALPDSSICAVIETEDEFTLFECDGGAGFSIGRSDLVQSGTAAVLACAESIAVGGGFHPAAIGLFSPTSGTISDSSAEFGAGIEAALPMLGGSMALTTSGVRSGENDSCADLIDMPDAEEPMLITLDDEFVVEASYPLPEGVAWFEHQILGEISRPSGDGSLIVVSSLQGIWAVDSLTEQWLKLTDFSIGGGPDGTPSLRGDVIYSGRVDGIGVIELTWEEDELMFDERVLDYLTASISEPSRVRTMIELDERHLLSIDFFGRVWIVDLPQRELAE
ncbi:MAG: hypothetical protein R8J94_06505 [Acidimicrobiia bacterium]|nr:hypothetical protein [Acidimicrobiia bacterium]